MLLCPRRRFVQAVKRPHAGRPVRRAGPLGAVLLWECAALPKTGAVLTEKTRPVPHAQRRSVGSSLLFQGSPALQSSMIKSRRRTARVQSWSLNARADGIPPSSHSSNHGSILCKKLDSEIKNSAARVFPGAVKHFVSRVLIKKVALTPIYTPKQSS